MNQYPDKKKRSRKSKALEEGLRALSRRGGSDFINAMRNENLSGNAAAAASSYGLIQISPIMASPISNHHRVWLRYTETVQLATGAAGIIGSTNLFRLNSLFDPNQTGTGHQPYGYDQWCNFYQNYRVEEVDSVALFTTPGGTADICCALYTSTVWSTIAGATSDAVTERPQVRTGVLSPSGKNRSNILGFRTFLHKMKGITKAAYDADDQYQALTSASPSFNFPLEVGIGSYSGVASQAASCQVTINYLCYFFNPITLGQS